MQGQDLKDCIGAGAGDDQVRGGKEVLQILFDVFELLIALNPSFEASYLPAPQR